MRLLLLLPRSGGGGVIQVGDEVRVGGGSATATVLEVTVSRDEAGEPYEMARLKGARGRVFVEETARLRVVRKAGKR